MYLRHTDSYGYLQIHIMSSSQLEILTKNVHKVRENLAYISRDGDVHSNT